MRVLILVALAANLVVMVGRPGETSAQPAAVNKRASESATIFVPADATITFAPAVTDVKIRPATTDQGAVVRVEIPGVTIEAAKMRLRHKGQDHELTANDGKMFNVK